MPGCAAWPASPTAGTAETACEEGRAVSLWSVPQKLQKISVWDRVRLHFTQKVGFIIVKTRNLSFMRRWQWNNFETTSCLLRQFDDGADHVPGLHFVKGVFHIFQPDLTRHHLVKFQPSL